MITMEQNIHPDLAGLSQDELDALFDTTPEEFGEPELNPGLSSEEIEEADYLKQYKRGVGIVTGEPGGGKDTFMHFLLFKLKTLFAGTKIFLDRKPRPLFGKYIPFTTNTLLNGFKALDEKYKTGKRNIKNDFSNFSENKQRLNNVIEEWFDQNEEMFFNSAIGLGELWRYFYNREPHNPMNRAMQPLMKRYRHYETLIIGTTPHPQELDIKSCLEYATHEIIVSQTKYEGLHLALVYKLRFFNGSCIVDSAAPVDELYIDGLEPRPWLGGDYAYHLFNSKERGEGTPRVFKA